MAAAYLPESDSDVNLARFCNILARILQVLNQLERFSQVLNLLITVALIDVIVCIFIIKIFYQLLN